MTTTSYLGIPCLFSPHCRIGGGTLALDPLAWDWFYTLGFLVMPGKKDQGFQDLCFNCFQKKDP